MGRTPKLGTFSRVALRARVLGSGPFSRGRRAVERQNLFRLGRPLLPAALSSSAPLLACCCLALLRLLALALAIGVRHRALLNSERRGSRREAGGAPARVAS